MFENKNEISSSDENRIDMFIKLASQLPDREQERLYDMVKGYVIGITREPIAHGTSVPNRVAVL